MTDWIAGFSSARFTLLIGAIAIVTGAIGGFALAREALYKDFVTSAALFKAAAGAQDDALVTEKDLRELPEPMARHMRFSGVLGKKRISAVHLIHSGQFKPGADRAWMPIDGEYFITTKKPSFFWYGKVNIVPGISFIALDSYAAGSGRMVVKLMSVFRIVDDRSPQVSASSFGRAVAELTMAPTFFLDRARVRCMQTGHDLVRCTVTDGELSTDADLFFNPTVRSIASCFCATSTGATARPLSNGSLELDRVRRVSADACWPRGWTASGTCRKAICTMSVSTSTASNSSRDSETTVCL